MITVGTSRLSSNKTVRRASRSASCGRNSETARANSYVAYMCSVQVCRDCVFVLISASHKLCFNQMISDHSQSASSELSREQLAAKSRLAELYQKGLEAEKTRVQELQSVSIHPA